MHIDWALSFSFLLESRELRNPERFRLTAVCFRFIRRFLVFCLYFCIFVIAFSLRPGTDTEPTSRVERHAGYNQTVIVKDPCYLLRHDDWVDDVRESRHNRHLEHF